MCQPWQRDVSSLLYWHHHRWQRLGVTVKGIEGMFVVSVGTLPKNRQLDPPYWEVVLKPYTLCRIDPSALTQRNILFSHEPFSFASNLRLPHPVWLVTGSALSQWQSRWANTGWSQAEKQKNTTTSSFRAVAQLAPHHHWTLTWSLSCC